MLLLFISILIALGLQMPGKQPYRLQCEHLYSPIGIDEPNPRLSWQLSDKGPGGRQVAYTLSVATDSLGLIQKHHANFTWSIHRASTAQLVTYRGEPLKPHTRYYWRVTVQDKSGKNYSSSIASFETGVIKESNWKGDWITGLRYIEVTSTSPVKLTTGNLAPIVEHSDLLQAGKFSSANRKKGYSSIKP